MTAKDKLNLYLLENGLPNSTSNELPKLEQCQEVIQTFLKETLDQRTTSLLQLEDVHEQLSLALEKAPVLDQEFYTLFTTQLNSFNLSSPHVATTTTSNELTTNPPPFVSKLTESQIQKISKLKQLCLLKDRLHQASRALQDALRWSSLSPQINTWIELEDWNAAANLLLQTTEDVNLFKPFLPPFELQRRLHILDELYNVFLKAVAPKFVVQLQTRQSSALPILISLKKLAQYCRIHLYKQVRLSELESYLSSLDSSASSSSSSLDALGDWLERESTWLAQALDYETRSSLLLDLIQETLPFTLPADPEICFLFLHRMERLFHIESDSFQSLDTNLTTPTTIPSLFLQSFQSLLLTLAESPSSNLTKYQKRFIELCQPSSSSALKTRSTSPTRSPFEELHEWRNSLPSILALFEQYWKTHLSICGPYLRYHLQSGITTLWQQLLRKHLELLPKQLSSTSITLDQHSFEPYQLILEYASQLLLPTSHRLQSLWNAPLHSSTLSTLPYSLRHHLNANDSMTSLSSPDWPKLTLDWMYQRLDQFLKLLLQPILKHLPKDLIQPSPPPTLTSPHLISMKLPQFSLSPSPPITFVGDYLLQLPHYLDFQYTFPHPYVFGPTLSSLPTILSPTSSTSTSSQLHGNDFIVTLGLIIQMEVLRGFYLFKPKLEYMDQIKMDLNYLTNILNSLECSICIEWNWLLDMINNTTNNKDDDVAVSPFSNDANEVPSNWKHPSSFIMQFWDGLSKKQSYSVWAKQFQAVVKKMVAKEK